MKKIRLWVSALLLAGITAGCQLTVNNTSTTYADGSVASPVTLTVGSTYAGQVGIYSDGAQNSYYAFYATGAGIYYIDVTALSVSADLDVYIYENDPSFTYSTGSSTSVSTGSLYLNYTTSGAGWVYMKIKNFTNTDGVNYNLRVY